MLRTLFCLTLLLALAAPLRAQDYPAADGFVTDSADMLSAATETTLEAKLADFKSATSIEVAVATIKTLGSLDSDAYCVGLANHWGVGDPQTNNGVTLLVAQKERKLALWFGDGYDTAWSNQTSTRIRELEMVPQLKAGKPDAAVQKGVEAIVREVTTAGYVDRWADNAGTLDPNAPTFSRPPAGSETPSHAAAAPVAPPDPADVRLGLYTVGGILGGLLALIFGVRSAGIRRKRRALRTEIDLLTEELTHKLELIGPAEQQLRSGYPESMWGPALSALNMQAFERLLYTDASRFGVADLTRQRDELAAAGGRIQHAIDLLRRADASRSETPRLLRSMPVEVDSVRAALDNPEVLPETRARLAPAEARLRELTAALPAGEAPADWAKLGDDAQRLQAELSELRSQAERDAHEVREARQSLPQLLADTQEQLQTLRAKNKGRYNDVDSNLDEAERLLGFSHGYRDSLDSAELMQIFRAITNALTHTQTAETSYRAHTTPKPSSSPFSGGSTGGRSSGGFSGGSSGRSGGGGGSSSW